MIHHDLAISPQCVFLCIWSNTLLHKYTKVCDTADRELIQCSDLIRKYIVPIQSNIGGLISILYLSSGRVSRK